MGWSKNLQIWPRDLRMAPKRAQQSSAFHSHFFRRRNHSKPCSGQLPSRWLSSPDDSIRLLLFKVFFFLRHCLRFCFRYWNLNSATRWSSYGNRRRWNLDNIIISYRVNKMHDYYKYLTFYLLLSSTFCGALRGWWTWGRSLPDGLRWSMDMIQTNSFSNSLATS